MSGSRKSSYETIPLSSRSASCGKLVQIESGKSYSVIMMRVALPVGRGSASVHISICSSNSN